MVGPALKGFPKPFSLISEIQISFPPYPPSRLLTKYKNLPKEKQAHKISDLELEIITQKTGEEVILKSVQFTHNSFELDESSFSELNKLLAYLNKNPQIKISIEGHTDNVGEEKKNQTLSEKRAIAVYNYLIQNKISENRLSYKGFGEIKALLSNETKNGRMTNRRTSFKIIQ